MDEYESLSNSRWERKYHVVFIPQYRIEKGHPFPDHVHTKYSVSHVMGYIESKSVIHLAQTY